MKLKRVTSFATLSGTILLAYLLTACTNTSTQSDHQHDHDDSAITQYNPKILNCVGPVDTTSMKLTTPALAMAKNSKHWS